MVRRTGPNCGTSLLWSVKRPVFDRSFWNLSFCAIVYGPNFETGLCFGTTGLIQSQPSAISSVYSPRLEADYHNENDGDDGDDHDPHRQDRTGHHGRAGYPVPDLMVSFY